MFATMVKPSAARVRTLYLTAVTTQSTMAVMAPPYWLPYPGSTASAP